MRVGPSKPPDDTRRPSRRHVLTGLAAATGVTAAAGFNLLRPSRTDVAVTPLSDASVTPQIDSRRTLIVTARDSTSVALIAFDENRLLGHLDLGLAPRELRVSDGGVLIAAADRHSHQLAFAELATQKVRRVDLPNRPTRLVVSPDGATLAAIDEDSGEIALIDFRSGRITLCFQGPAHIRAVIFSPDAALLFVGADTAQGVAIFDLASGRLAATIDSPPVVDLVRSPNGREAFAITADGEHSILHLDLKSRAILGRITGRPAAAVFTTGFGRYLLLPDPDAGTMTIASVQSLQPGPLLAAGAGVSTAYSAWFDTVALVPSAPGPKVFVYDLEAGRSDGAIALAGRPGLGSTSPEGDKFYLPVEDSGEVVVIDTRDRRQVSAISVGGAPVRAVLAAGYGICH
jgi:DNA-binding beta-propeller fold protein YncE